MGSQSVPMRLKLTDSSSPKASLHHCSGLWGKSGWRLERDPRSTSLSCINSVLILPSRKTGCLHSQSRLTSSWEQNECQTHSLLFPFPAIWFHSVCGVEEMSQWRNSSMSNAGCNKNTLSTCFIWKTNSIIFLTEIWGRAYSYAPGLLLALCLDRAVPGIQSRALSCKLCVWFLWAISLIQKEIILKENLKLW